MIDELPARLDDLESIPDSKGRGWKFMRWFLAGCFFLAGCGDSTSDVSNLRPTTESTSQDAVSQVLRDSAAHEILALSAGATNNRKPIIGKRLQFLKSVANGQPAKWSDSNSNRKDCLDLAHQLEALAIGQGYVSDQKFIASRMDRLRNMLRLAGYDFDDAGYENKYDESGSMKSGYRPLLTD